ncbi:carbohydrate ABC transporter permease [Paenibacillus chungangensis]|uniref:Carbohydrate ABC transporter permease n=1 Tax=Paenibacillus chungangensis TaxID=696535 RepID=A0ABW3HR80_9BACL
MYYKNRGYKVFSVFNTVFLIGLSLLCIMPLIHILAVSFSGRGPATANIIGLWPIDFTIESYEKTLSSGNFLRSITNSVLRTVIGTIVGMSLIVAAGYALSKENPFFKTKAVYTWFFVFTMLFNGGLVPTYVLISKIHLMNSFWVLILPGAVSVYNMILMMNFFKAVPRELEEAAYLDGAGVFITLWKVYLPVSLPAIATLSLFTLVWHWNSWFDGLIYLTDVEKYPMATYLQTIVVQQDFSKISLDPQSLENMSQRTVKAAQIFITALPVLVIYPFLQKYFVKGIVLGAVKE